MIGLEGACMTECMRTWAVSKETNDSELDVFVVLQQDLVHSC